MDTSALYQAATTLAANLLWQSTALTAAGLLAAYALRKRGAAVQSAIYRCALAAVVLSPLALMLLNQPGAPGIRFELPKHETAQLSIPAPPLPAQNAPLLQINNTAAEPQRIRLNTPPLESPPAVTATETAESAKPAALNTPTPFSIQNLYPAIAWCWCLGSAFLLLRTFACMIRCKRLLRNAEPADDRTRALVSQLSETLGVNAPAAAQGEEVKSPFLLGLFKPVILLPKDHNFSDEELTSVLIHELAHVKRRDVWWNLLSRLTACILFFQPLVWRLNRRLEQANDNVCDDYAVQSARDKKEYARLLVNIAERFQPSRAEQIAGVGALSFRSSLGSRVKRILEPSRALSLKTGAGALALMIASSMFITLSTGAVRIGQEQVYNLDDKVEARITPADDVTRSFATVNSPGSETAPYQSPLFAELYSHIPIVRASKEKWHERLKLANLYPPDDQYYETLIQGMERLRAETFDLSKNALVQIDTLLTENNGLSPTVRLELLFTRIELLYIRQQYDEALRGGDELLDELNWVLDTADGKIKAIKTKTLYLLGQIAWDSVSGGDYSKTVEYYTKALDEDDGYPAEENGETSHLAALRLTNVLSMQGKYEEAIGRYKKAIEQSPNNGYSYLTHHYYAKALEARADQIQPQSPENAKELYREAAQQYQNAVQKRSTSKYFDNITGEYYVEIHFRQALCAYKAGMLEGEYGAKRLFETFIESFTKDPFFNNKTYREKYYDRAKNYLDRITKEIEASPKINAVDEEVYKGKTFKQWLALLEGDADKIDDDQRSDMLFAIRHFGYRNGEAVPSLVKKIKERAYIDAGNYAFALGQLGKKTVPEIIKLMKDNDPQVRHFGIEATTYMQHNAKDAIPAVIHCAQNDPDPFDRMVAIFALEEIGKYESTVTPGLIHVYRFGSKEHKNYAARAMSTIGRNAASALPVLLADLRSGTDEDRELAAQTLARMTGRLGNDALPALQPLINALDDPRGKVRAHAAAALGWMRDHAKPALPALRKKVSGNEQEEYDVYTAAIAFIEQDN